MENMTSLTSMLESVFDLMRLDVAIVVGGVFIAIWYAVNRLPWSRQDSQKTTYFLPKNDFVPASESPTYIPPSTPPMQPREFANKRAKNKKRREAQQERAHPWIMGTLKGHTGQVNDMDFSSNGRYLASCADDENLRETRKHVQPHGHHTYKKKESKKKTSSSLQTDCTESQSSGRREEKETGKASRSRSRGSPLFSFQHGAVSEEASSLEVSSSDTSSNDDIPYESQQQMTVLNNIPASLVSTIRKYTLSEDELFKHGYPVESYYAGYAVINNVSYPSGPNESDSGRYSNSSSSDNSEQESSSDNEKNFDNENSPVKEKPSDNRDSSQNEEKCDSESSSLNEKSLEDQSSSENERSCDSESSSDGERSPDDGKSSENEKSCDSANNSGSEKSPENRKNCSRKGSPTSKSSSDDEMCLDKKRLDEERSCGAESNSDCEKSPDNRKGSDMGNNARPLERTCARCYKKFYADQNGEYLSEERCIYHYGKLHNRMINNSWYWTCCNQARFSPGCAEWKLHVWTGLVPGINGPFPEYVQTVPAPMFTNSTNYGIYAMDCEMCFTLNGLELARVSIVSLYGDFKYDTLVKPSSEIIDYNTKFSGIREEDMANVTKTLPEVQCEILGFIYAETILMGHGLGNDLRALRLIHKNVVDTCVMFPHYLGLPYRNGLKTLARTVLKQEIQEETHDSLEDSRVVAGLVLKKAHHEWQQSFESA